MKILLLQARQLNDKARLDERHSFAQRAKLADTDIVPFDLLTAAPTLDHVRQYDALMIGGSGDYYVSKGNLPTNEPVLELFREVVESGHPTFASCFGFHLLVEALGGQVIYDADNMEVGTYELKLSETGQQDELFSYLPTTFKAQLGHKDRANVIPHDVLNLASSDNAPYQAVRIPGKPIWATQFHPELTGQENLDRFHRYMEGYAGMMDEGEIQKTLQRFVDSPETDQMIGRFLEIVFS
jgi:GMP synthase (glutamine-hydrolysing)